jgi:hypothetical protein
MAFAGSTARVARLLDFVLHARDVHSYGASFPFSRALARFSRGASTAAYK